MWWTISVLWAFWCSCALSQKCITPFGKYSSCVSLYDCPDLLNAAKQKPLSQYVLSFLQKSKCGVKGTFKVCCGPVPDDKPKVNLTTPETSTPSQITANWIAYSSEDSLPAPRDQCGNENFEHRIYSGEDTEIYEFPWMALLGYKTNTSPVNYLCGGSLINHRYVLTAAHCLVGNYMTKYGPLTNVRLGEYDMSPESIVDCKYGICADHPQEISVASTYAHPQYEITNPSRTHDIGIVRLAWRAVYTDYVQPICLVYGKEPISDGDETVLFFSGWGRTLEGPPSLVKKKLNLTFFNRENCVEKYRNKGAFLSDTQLCAGGRFREDGCQGDSGGPLMMKTHKGIWEAIGVGSFGRGCGLDGWPGVYTSVAHYLGWIENTLQMSNH
ncbi:unnamed protein product [Arctia plantaginis]|uniref:CLIP domain-containing serine protease n=1 Tax=Arctia plantaginis TaxID=874455 RepID=A0A8S1AMP8_ARCPL|nr:unnamed protein product [Arctia plantaginis]CAB3247982.1 unnamed protein product [Arctia plantaginis]